MTVVAFQPLASLELVAELAHGSRIYREPNKAGGHRYWSDAIGAGFVIWDTCLATEEELLVAIGAERQRLATSER